MHGKLWQWQKRHKCITNQTRTQVPWWLVYRQKSPGVYDYTKSFDLALIYWWQRQKLNILMQAFNNILYIFTWIDVRGKIHFEIKWARPQPTQPPKLWAMFHFLSCEKCSSQQNCSKVILKHIQIYLYLNKYLFIRNFIFCCFLINKNSF